ncbi:ABC transporter ATP-binding protein [Rubritalea tangerina]|uniref:ABC transporter ATP-binding protein n=1 Tax=Rubritalea tangerina TaxID=430798 RepID=A0ABW4Z7W6_9BACT
MVNVTEAAVEIKDLVKTYPSSFRRKTFRAVDEVSLRIQKGEVYGLIGPNGSGKSTTMKALLGLVAPTSGECRVFGYDSMKVDARKYVGFLPENPYFYKHQTAVETLKFYGKLCGMRGKQLEGRIRELLELVSLEDAKDRRLGGYSKGMLQRVGLAQALIQDPQLVVLDEPTAGVDPVGSRQIRDLIFKLKESGVTVFLCSHLLEQVQEVCDQVGILFNGKMVMQGSVDSLTAVSSQREILVEGIESMDMEQLESMLTKAGGKLIECSAPRKSLENLFLEIAKQSGEEAR